MLLVIRPKTCSTLQRILERSQFLIFCCIRERMLTLPFFLNLALIASIL